MLSRSYLKRYFLLVFFTVAIPSGVCAGLLEEMKKLEEGDKSKDQVIKCLIALGKQFLAFEERVNRRLGGITKRIDNAYDLLKDKPNQVDGGPELKTSLKKWQPGKGDEEIHTIEKFKEIDGSLDQMEKAFGNVEKRMAGLEQYYDLTNRRVDETQNLVQEMANCSMGSSDDRGGKDKKDTPIIKEDGNEVQPEGTENSED